MTSLEIDRFIETTSAGPARIYTAAIQDMIVAMARGNRPALDDARRQLLDVVSETMGMAEVLGASQILRAALKAAEETPDLTRFAAEPSQTLLPRVTLTEALEDMIERTPVTLRLAAERTAQRISQLYGERRVVAFARSAEAAVTKRAQALIAQAIAEGFPEAKIGRGLRLGIDEIRKRTAAWSEGYARMAFRTNLNTAVTAGRFRQAQDQDIRKVVPAFRFDTVGDSDTRDNHQAGDGKIMRVDNLAWNRLAPPLGYSCRCQVSFVGLPELRRLGRVTATGGIREDRPPRAWHPDPGFRLGGRPDLFMSDNADPSPDNAGGSIDIPGLDLGIGI